MEQLWAQCDTCAKWRRLPESMHNNIKLNMTWTCAMHPDPARIGCEVAEEGLEEDEVTTQMKVVQGSCGTPGCKYADFHFGPCSNCRGAASGGKRPRRRSSLGEGMGAEVANVSKVAKSVSAKACMPGESQSRRKRKPVDYVSVRVSNEISNDMERPRSLTKPCVLPHAEPAEPLAVSAVALYL